MRQTTAKNETLKRWAVLACLFLVAWIPRVILCMQTVPVRTLSDELATISGAAYFAGLDWSAVISNAGYYGSGFSALFAPLFLLTDNPFVIYKGMLIGASVVKLKRYWGSVSMENGVFSGRYCSFKYFTSV